MKRLAPGFRDLAGFFVRQVERVRLMLDQRKLARLETALGLLGWQQADYDLTTQAHVDRVTACEREQARLTNESAALGLDIERLEAERGVREREFREAEAAALEKEHPAAANTRALDAQLIEKRQEHGAVEARLPVLDQELSAAEAQYREHVAAEIPTPHQREELLRLRKLILALPQEKAEWQAREREIGRRIELMESLLARLREARRSFENRDEELTASIAARRRAKAKMEKEIDALEEAKSEPYREIGRSLADQEIAPLNQPGALTAVLEQRRKIAARKEAIAASATHGAREKSSAVS